MTLVSWARVHPYAAVGSVWCVMNDFTTFEVAELVMPRVVKSNDVREPFNEEKLRSGMLRALEKRPVSSDDVEMAINHIKSQLRVPVSAKCRAR